MINVKEDFFNRKKDKAFYKTVYKWLNNEKVEDIELAKALSSMLTHSLIEIKGTGSSMYEILSVELQAKCLSEFIGGDMNADTLREIYSSRFGSFIRRNE